MWLYCRKCEQVVPYKGFGYDFGWHKKCTIFDRPGRTMRKEFDFASHGRAYSNMKAVTLIPDHRGKLWLKRGKVKFGGTDLELLALQADRE